MAGGAAGEEDGVRRDHRAPLLPRAGAALKLSVGLASHALTVAPEAVVSEARATPRRRRQIALFDSTGLAIQDFAIARAAVEDAAGLDLPPLEL